MSGLLPALARGLDVEALRDGARTVGPGAARGRRASKDFAPAVGAAVAIGLAKERGVKASVMMPYSDRLSRFAAWYVQLWGESLGKQGRRDNAGRGARARSISTASSSSISTARRSTSSPWSARLAQALAPASTPDLAKLANAEYLAGHTAGDLVAAQQRAIPEALIAARRPVRTIDIERLDERALGALMMHFMLETILAGAAVGRRSLRPACGRIG